MENFVKYLQTNSGATSTFITGIMKQNYSNEEYWSEVIPLLDFSDSKVVTWVLDNSELFNLKYLVRYAHNLNTELIN